MNPAVMSSKGKNPMPVEGGTSPFDTNALNHELTPTAKLPDSDPQSNLYSVPDTNTSQSMPDTTSLAMPAVSPASLSTIPSLTEFNRFPKLPPELRREVWLEMASVRRIIELDGVSDTFDLAPVVQWQDDEWPEIVRIAPNSRNLPVVLQLSHESRTTALKVYFLTDFENKPAGQTKHQIYYNPQVDIVYFGQNSGFPTLDAVLRKGLEMPNVAISYIDDWAGRFAGFSHPLRLLELLHGVDPAVVQEEDWDSHQEWGLDPFPGCKGLKMVYFVLPGHHLPDVRGDNMPVHFAAAPDTVVQEIEYMIVARDRHNFYQDNADSRLPSCDELRVVGRELNMREGCWGSLYQNRWIGAAKPSFCFVNLDRANSVCRTIKIAMTARNKRILQNPMATIRKCDMPSGSGGHVRLGPRVEFLAPEVDEHGCFVPASAREIKFFGSKEDAQAAEMTFRLLFLEAQVKDLGGEADLLGPASD